MRRFVIVMPVTTHPGRVVHEVFSIGTGRAECGATVPQDGQVFPVTEIDLEAGLRRLDYQSFRPGQREAIETLMTSGRVLLVAPAGGGKSLTYQLPALSLGGTPLVISRVA